MDATSLCRFVEFLQVGRSEIGQSCTWYHGVARVLWKGRIEASQVLDYLLTSLDIDIQNSMSQGGILVECIRNDAQIIFTNLVPVKGRCNLDLQLRIFACPFRRCK